MSKLPSAAGAVKGLEEWGHEWDCYCSSDYRGRLEEWDHEWDVTAVVITGVIWKRGS